MNKHGPRKSREVAVFKSNRSQAIRIPKEFAFPEGLRKVTITQLEDGLLVKPSKLGNWAEYFRTRPDIDEESAREMLKAVANDPPPEPVPSFDD